MKIIVTGATGTVGAEVVRQAMIDDSITQIIAIVRNPPEMTHPKLKIIVHKDFLHYDSLLPLFAECDACLWCLGVSQTQVSKQQYMVITYEYTLAAAQAMLKANPRIKFLFVSGGGADSTEKSRTLFARVKGQTENALQRLAWKELIIARPGGIQPIHKDRNLAFAYKLFLPLFPIFRLLAPSKVITSVELAKALLYAVKRGTDKVILENIDLKKLALKAR
jgi:uncharacterized protein YbjT (DUF2867 family)